MEFGLIQQQTTSLVMTQELRQAIHLLQLSATDLTSYIHEQALENPLIEVKEEYNEHEHVRSEQVDLYSSFSSRSSQGEDHSSPIDYAMISRVSLGDYLLEQVQELKVTTNNRKQIIYFIYSLRDDGYLSRPLEDICEELSIEIDEGEQILRQVQALEPVGIGARNLQECLLLQLEQLHPNMHLAKNIITFHLEEFANRKWKELSVKLGVQLSELQNVHDFIQTLDPRPGTRFQIDPIQFITPELKIVAEGEHLSVHLIDHMIPSIRLNEHYRRLLRSEKNSEVNDYARQMSQQVVWLMRSIEQRKQTIIKVGEAIAKHQYEYFINQNGMLKPLTLKEVAEEIDVHESTVSRATTNKYAETPRGLLELKSLFSSAVQTDLGEKTSSQSIKQLLLELIKNENKQKPLSDAKISAWFQKEKDIVVSRRTIAKYRDELRIPSSTNRKRFD